jgi:hypothetical protein
LSSPPTIGNTTPNTGTFTTLTATGQTNLGGDVVVTNTPLIFKNASNNEAFRINTSGSNYWQVFGATTPVLRTNGGATSAKIGMGGAFPLSFVTNSIGTEAEQLRVSHTASAVNYVQVTGAATTVFPTISAQGSDTNLGLNIQSKGFGSTQFLGGAGGILFQINGTSASNRNYLRVESSATTISPVLSAQGFDTNIAATFQSKGTGAINLAPGSSGVNISNGRTVTAITTTASGASYTSAPTATISSPTTAGGVQATAQPYVQSTGAFTIANGGTGYTVGNVLTFSGGTGVVNATATVASVSAGVITGLTFTSGGAYTVVPTNPISVTGGTGTGATFNFTQYILRTSAPTWLITNAGSGYVEQPTVTFSGGGGSGAAAYAEIGSATSLKSLNDMTVNLPSGPVLSMTDSSVASGAGAYLNLSNGSSANAIQRAAGTATNIGVFWLSKGTSGHSFGTNNSTATEQLRVTHTASAVNFVQVTGAATGGTPTISAQGSDANVALNFQTKGVGIFRFRNGSNQTAFTGYALSGAANFVGIQSSVAGSAPILGAEGSDTNIDLALTPKGTGNVRFGTYTADMTLIVQGFIEVKDSGGTIRKLAVIA